MDKIGGIFDSYDQYLSSPMWLDKSDAYKKLIGHCELCGESQSLIVHHITYKNVCTESAEDLMCLCFGCHSKVHAINIHVFKERFNELTAHIEELTRQREYYKRFLKARGRLEKND